MREPHTYISFIVLCLVVCATLCSASVPGANSAGSPYGRHQPVLTAHARAWIQVASFAIASSSIGIAEAAGIVPESMRQPKHLLKPRPSAAAAKASTATVRIAQVGQPVMVQPANPQYVSQSDYDELDQAVTESVFFKPVRLQQPAAAVITVPQAASSSSSSSAPTAPAQLVNAARLPEPVASQQLAAATPAPASVPVPAPASSEQTSKPVQEQKPANTDKAAQPVPTAPTTAPQQQQQQPQQLAIGLPQQVPAAADKLQASSAPAAVADKPAQQQPQQQQQQPDVAGPASSTADSSFVSKPADTPKPQSEIPPAQQPIPQPLAGSAEHKPVVSQPVAQPETQPSTQPAQQPVANSLEQKIAEQPVMIKTQQPAIQPVQQAATGPTEQKQMEQPVMIKIQQPTLQPAQQPLPGSAEQKAAEQPAWQPIQQPSPQPVTQPAQQPAAAEQKQAVELVAELVRKPMPQPVQPPTAGTTEQKHVSQPVAEPIQQPMLQPALQPAAEQKPVTQPAAEPMPQPVTQPTAGPTEQTSAQPAAEPVQQPTQQLVAGSAQQQPAPGTVTEQPLPTSAEQKPVAQPVAEPVQQPTPQPSAPALPDATAAPEPSSPAPVASDTTAAPVPVTQPSVKSPTGTHAEQHFLTFGGEAPQPNPHTITHSSTPADGTSTADAVSRGTDQPKQPQDGTSGPQSRPSVKDDQGLPAWMPKYQPRPAARDSRLQSEKVNPILAPDAATGPPAWMFKYTPKQKDRPAAPEHQSGYLMHKQKQDRPLPDQRHEVQLQAPSQYYRDDLEGWQRLNPAPEAHPHRYSSEHNTVKDRYAKSEEHTTVKNGEYAEHTTSKHTQSDKQGEHPASKPKQSEGKHKYDKSKADETKHDTDEDTYDPYKAQKHGSQHRKKGGHKRREHRGAAKRHHTDKSYVKYETPGSKPANSHYEDKTQQEAINTICNANYKLMHNRKTYRNVCLRELGRNLLEGTPRRPVKFISALECCDKQSEDRYAYNTPQLQKPAARLTVAVASVPTTQPITASDIGQVQSTAASDTAGVQIAGASSDGAAAAAVAALPVANMAAAAPIKAPAGHCTLELEYFDKEQITKDGLCIGTVKAQCELHDLCDAAHLDGQSLTIASTGVLKAKPAKIKVDAEDSSKYSYSTDPQYLPGTAVVAYVPIPISHPPGTEQYPQSEKGPLYSLLKVKVGWYDEKHVYPDIGDNGDGVVYTAGYVKESEQPATMQLPEVEPGTFNFLLKRGDYIY